MKIVNILYILAVLAVGILIGWLCRGRLGPDIDRLGPLIDRFGPGTKTDTTIVIDTNIYINPPAISFDIGITEETIEVPSSEIIIKNDSLVVLPMQTKRYKGKDYELEISGYSPNLDWINIFPETKYVTNNIVDNRRNMLYLSGEMIYSSRFMTSVLLNYEYRWKYISLGASVGYEFINQIPIVTGKIIIPLKRW